MSFKEWSKIETGQEWNELQEQGMTNEQIKLLLIDYEEYCEENNLSPSFKNH
ncbi:MULTISPECIES: hypothetical protein [Bacillus cereus group]|uniref:Uncharacterized protein n=1 Tax=Bacillus cereus (strain G9842) TaxID=405531 RepID=B7IZ43_BACC2|nr:MULTISPECIES: hypothetical protein [Bacillus cereus group]ACK98623.1 hypothetical protein BCG9842_0020 [Bacillus cereus G9842]